MTRTALVADGDLTSMGETRAFTMRADAKAFRMFVDSLYSDKIKAPIRELASNAYDAHVVAGKAGVPFEMHLPTLIEPEFRVRDFGPGMDHDTVMELYTCMFSSTKDGSNEEVGGFGIGSKSPFAYTDTFSVTAFDGTHRRDYFAHLSTAGIPQLTHLETTHDTSPRGVLVSFPVAVKDFGSFAEAWAKLEPGFITKPVMSGHEYEPEPQPESFMSGPGWVAYETRNYWDTASVLIRQGCVIYPGPDFLRPSAWRSLKVVIDVPVGTFGVAATREALEWDHESRSLFNAMAEDIRGQQAGMIQAKIEAATSRQAALKEARTWSRTLSALYGDNFLGKDKVFFRGRPLRTYVEIPAPKPGQPALLMRAGKACTKVEYRLDNFLVVRREIPVPREATRLAALRRDVGTDQVLTTYATGKVLKKLIQLLDLPLDRVIPAAKLDDVVISRSPRGKAKLEGVYGPHGLVSDPKLLPKEFGLYLKLDRNTSHWKGEGPGFYSDLLGMPVYACTQSAVARLTRMGGTLLDDTMVREALEPYRGQAQIEADYEATTEAMGYELRYGDSKIKAAILAAEGVVVPVVNYRHPDHEKVQFAIRQLSVRGKALLTKASLRRKYPLIIDPSDGDKLDYVAAQNTPQIDTTSVPALP